MGEKKFRKTAVYPVCNFASSPPSQRRSTYRQGKGYENIRWPCHSIPNLINNFIFLCQVYDGYMDDERNTDNAWLETSVKHFHDDGNALRRFFLNVSHRVDLKINHGVDLQSYKQSICH